MNSGSGFDSVITGRSELGLTDARDIPEALESVELGSQTLVFILPPGWSSERWQPVGPEGNRHTPFVAAPEGTSTRRLLDEHLASAGLQPRLSVVSAQRDAILPLVLAGAGAALVPESMALIAERLGAVVSRPDPPAVRQVALVYRSGPLSPAAGRFLELAVAPAPEWDGHEADPSSSGIRTRAASPSAGLT